MIDKGGDNAARFKIADTPQRLPSGTWFEGETLANVFGSTYGTTERKRGEST